MTAGEIAVIGSGIGGLAAAIALRAKGLSVRVYEQAGSLSEIGAGVSLGANGMRVLDALGLGGPVRAVSSNLARICFHHWRTGAVDYQHPMGDWYEQRFGGPFLGIHRADFHRVLRSAFDSLVHLNHRCTGIRETTDGVQMLFADGSSTRRWSRGFTAPTPSATGEEPVGPARHDRRHFTAPLVMPEMIRRWAIANVTISGRLIRST
ncbi:NAD(P)-binding protein [Actinoplanes derwentensis]|uniref:NAD(P)-binding Rossmann-like domain-containing protein n=1 Tax=Actinoplanes derwentensis TaxID=113562 RepID=A0A1H1Z1C5_9ACTN|nr:NAD(P)-binding protein [Actinoplanes derwentensis]GID81384.1 hypothetical protein Ade03nite_03080 [Actinoplanes derwentensis]SDT27500.1 NAD(P)-binding Rossmann-like domain-containing protein [Actinoplanes derwentensis]